MSARAPYQGRERKLVLAIDVGTTYSGISYTILDPGKEPKIHPVTRFPGRAIAGGDAKVPTVIYYARDGRVRAIGAETEQEGFDARVEDSWVKAEWFKLHLRPKTRATSAVTEDIPSLPPGKTVVDVFADFLRYMKQCAKTFIEESHPVDGANFWKSGKEEYILSHPNAWEGAQQTLMRKAAVQAGLISDSAVDHERIHFVTEGEASLNFCLERGLMNHSIQRGEGVIIVDAGGGTVDLSTYSRKPAEKDVFEEIAAAQSYFKGSIFVTRAAARFLDDFLGGSRFHDDVSFMVEKFDKCTKLLFRDSGDPQYIKFGNVRDKDPSRNITRGQLKLEGTVIAGFFEPSVQCMVDAVLEQERLATKKTKTVFLVGGFAASDYLFSELEKRLQKHGFSVCRPDPHLNKAVPDGSIAGYLRPSVKSRVSRLTYGVRCLRPFDPSDNDHAKRLSTVGFNLRGIAIVPGAFSHILERHTQVTDTQEFRKSYRREIPKGAEFDPQTSTQILCYRGSVESPQFLDQDPGHFHDIFTIRADISSLFKQATECAGDYGSYYELEYDIVILFGLTEFKVQLAWMERGIEKRSPAEIVFDTEIEYED